MADLSVIWSKTGFLNLRIVILFTILWEVQVSKLFKLVCEREKSCIDLMIYFWMRDVDGESHSSMEVNTPIFFNNSVRYSCYNSINFSNSRTVEKVQKTKIGSVSVYLLIYFYFFNRKVGDKWSPTPNNQWDNC